MSYECSINLLTALDWQRSNADVIQNLITKKQEWYEANHCDFWNDWVTDVFNLDTANDFGLSVWAIILDEPIYGVVHKSPPDYPAWGFGEFMKNFSNGNFGTNSDTGFNFTTEQIRIALKLKAYILHMNGSTRDTNAALARIFGADKITCLDGLDMTLTYVVKNQDIVDFVEQLVARDLLPRPSGVGVKVVLNANVKQWGFGSNFKNFGNGNFITGVIA